MPVAALNGIELYYEINGSGPWVVLAHGGGSNHLTWWKNVHALMDEFAVVTFDHRGFGRSTGGEGGPRMFADDLSALLDHLKVEKTALVGQSMGGYTCAGFATRNPTRVSALILTSGAAGLLPPPSGGHSANAAARASGSASYMDWLQTDRHADGFFKRDPKDYFLFYSIGALNFAVDPRWMKDVIGLQYDIAPINEHKIPLLMIAGEEDRTNHKVALDIAELIPHAEVTAIPEAGHHVMFERADQANLILLNFLRRTAGPA